MRYPGPPAPHVAISRKERDLPKKYRSGRSLQAATCKQDAAIRPFNQIEYCGASIAMPVVVMMVAVVVVVRHPVALLEAMPAAIPEVGADQPGLFDHCGFFDSGTQASRRHCGSAGGERTGGQNRHRCGK